MRNSPIECIAALVCLTLSLTACKYESASDSATGTAAKVALPVPAANGAVTGSATMGQGHPPDLGQGPHAAVAGDDATTDAALNPEAAAQPAMDEAPMPGEDSVTNAAAGQPNSADAVAVIRDYYAAINARDYAQAYLLWADAGAASKQSPQQFATGFARTNGVSVTIGKPGNEDAGAGQRYVRIPVDLRATQADGSVQHFNGDYVLHRTVVDGASAEQRNWRIQSADLRLVQ